MSACAGRHFDLTHRIGPGEKKEDIPMAKFRLGKTELMVEKQGFGCLPIQRCTKEEAAALLRRAVDGGMNYFDSARGYSDSEEKIGYALHDVRDRIYLATKSHAQTGKELTAHLEPSRYIGCCPRQVEDFLANYIRPVLAQYPEALNEKQTELKV